SSSTRDWSSDVCSSDLPTWLTPVFNIDAEHHIFRRLIARALAAINFRFDSRDTREDDRVGGSRTRLRTAHFVIIRVAQPVLLIRVQRTHESGLETIRRTAT